MKSNAYELTITSVGPVALATHEFGDGQPYLLLHGGGGPTTVETFAESFAAWHHARVIVPVHPGFSGTSRADKLTTVAQLAALYVALLDELDLRGVTVVGNSIGGWIAAEMAVQDSPRLRGVVLVNAVGIEVPGHPVADFFSLTLDEVLALSYFNPEPFRFDPSTFTPAIQAIQASNRAALSTYAGTAMGGASLAERLAGVTVPTLVVWGDSDRIADPDYGRAYAAAIPTAHFNLIEQSGHMPQLETPEQLANAIWAFSARDAL